VEQETLSIQAIAPAADTDPSGIYVFGSRIFVAYPPVGSSERRPCELMDTISVLLEESVRLELVEVCDWLVDVNVLEDVEETSPGLRN